MSECVILYRDENGYVQYVSNGTFTSWIAVFPDIDAAITYCEDKLLREGTYQIVELDEL